MAWSIVAFAVGAVGATALTPVARAAARRYQVVDHGNNDRKRHDRPVPLLGGAALAVVLIVAVALGGWLGLWQPGSVGGSLVVALVSSTVLLCLVGLYDDVHDLGVGWKLVGQLAGIAPAVWWLPHVTQIELLGEPVHLGAWGPLLMASWLLAGINSLNFLDGSDGLASSVAIVVALACTLVAAWTGHTDVAILSALLAGALLGFLRYNAPPATVFLGDAGSMTIGFWLAALAFEAAVRPGGGLRPVTPIALLAVPLYDMALAVIRRLLEGRKIWHPDRGHVHHRLLDRGFTAWQTVAVLAGLSAVTSGAAILAVAWERDLPSAVGLVAMMAGLAFARLVGFEESKLVASHVSQWLARPQLLHERWRPVRRMFRAPQTFPGREELAAMSESQVYDSFVRALEPSDVRRLSITVDMRGGHPSKASAGPADITRWFQMTTESTPSATRSDPEEPGETALERVEGIAVVANVRCRIQAWTPHERRKGSSTSRALEEILDRYAQHWARRPRQLPSGQHAAALGLEVRERGDSSRPDADRAA